MMHSSSPSLFTKPKIDIKAVKETYQIINFQMKLSIINVSFSLKGADLQRIELHAQIRGRSWLIALKCVTKL